MVTLHSVHHSNYRGRFAPSPTGPLHLGSLLAAVASFLDAKSNKGTWLIRIEDIDPLREQKGASQHILETLNKHGLVSDEPVTFQSCRHSLYQGQLTRLINAGSTFNCPCSRKQLALSGHSQKNCPAPTDYPNSFAIKFRSPHSSLLWRDIIEGEQNFPPYSIEDDFVLLRKEGFFSYQFAVVCDDIEQSISRIVRGHDLLESTKGQQQLYLKFDHPPPQHAHLPLLFSQDGQKLSKQTGAQAIDSTSAVANLHQVLCYLNHPPPDTLKNGSVKALLDWGIRHWDIKRVQSIGASIKIAQH